MLAVIVRLATEVADLACEIGTDAEAYAGDPVNAAEAVARLKDARAALVKARAALRRQLRAAPAPTLDPALTE